MSDQTIRRSLAQIHSISTAEPHQRLAAAVIVVAQLDGDRAWLRSDAALAWCELLARGTIDPRDIIDRLAA
jgi:hypothetical protein